MLTLSNIEVGFLIYIRVFSMQFLGILLFFSFSYLILGFLNFITQEISYRILFYVAFFCFKENKKNNV